MSAKERLYIDLDICASGKCEKCVIQCSYFYHPENIGIFSVAEAATYALVCRKCEEAHCINSCPKDALEQDKSKDKLLKRHNMRCISCKSCAHACPYGTIYPELVPLLAQACDFCLDRRKSPGEPLCIKSCPHGALSLKSAEAEPDENLFFVGDNIVAHSTHWQWEKA